MPKINYTVSECLNLKNNYRVGHDVALFGLIKRYIFINKNACQIEIISQTLFSEKYYVDLCRFPIHMQFSSLGQLHVYKSDKNLCRHDNDRFGDDQKLSPLCQQWKNLKNLLQDDALVFSDGSYENIATDHGGIYCAYQVLEKYFENGQIFSSTSDNGTWENDPLPSNTVNDLNLSEKSRQDLTPKVENSPKTNETSLDPFQVESF